MADYSDYKECTDCVHYELCLHQEKFLIEHNRNATAPDLWSFLITNILRKNDFGELFKNLLILRKLLKLL